MSSYARPQIELTSSQSPPQMTPATATAAFGQSGPALLTVDQFCAFAALGRTTAYRLIREGKLQICKIGSRTLIKSDSVEALITSHTVSVAARGDR